MIVRGSVVRMAVRVESQTSRLKIVNARFEAWARYTSNFLTRGPINIWGSLGGESISREYVAAAAGATCVFLQACFYPLLVPASRTARFSSREAVHAREPRNR